MALTSNQLASVTTGNVIEANGNKIGGVGQIYLDDQTDEPNWVTVKTGLFGTSESFVPLSGASLSGSDIVVTYPGPNYDQATDRESTVGRDTSGPTTDDAMTLSEERLRVGTQTREAGRARLRKYVVTENVTQTVPVSRGRSPPRAGADHRRQSRPSNGWSSHQ